MASKRCEPRAKPWRARVKLQGVDYFIGVFATKEEAEAAEDAFRRSVGR